MFSLKNLREIALMWLVAGVLCVAMVGCLRLSEPVLVPFIKHVDPFKLCIDDPQWVGGGAEGGQRGP